MAPGDLGVLWSEVKPHVPTWTGSQSCKWLFTAASPSHYLPSHISFSVILHHSTFTSPSLLQLITLSQRGSTSWGGRVTAAHLQRDPLQPPPPPSVDRNSYSAYFSVTQTLWKKSYGVYMWGYVKHLNEVQTSGVEYILVLLPKIKIT